MKPPIRILIIEDHLGYRQVLERAISRQSNLKLVNQFGTAEIALRSLKTAKSESIPDVILLDLNLPGMFGLDTIPLLKNYVENIKIIILTQSDNEADILRAISLGAAGYLLKSATVNEITEGIKTVADGGASLDVNVAKFILKTVKNLPNQQTDNTDKSLSEREQEVLSLLSEGLVKQEIADQLGISITTVASHVRHIYEKLHVQNAPAAVSKAYRMGIFSPGKDKSPN
jgi:DNA-binding NarL/FixJ family response regulator